jgi:hypothetical protein
MPKAESAKRPRANPTVVQPSQLNFTRDGVCVLPNLVDQLPRIHALVASFVADWQLEFKNNTLPLVIGGFGAFGTASSFHAPPIRELNQMIHDVLMPLFLQLNPGKFVTSMFNRFCIRYPGTSTTPESAHRDTDPPHGFFYGGWLNTGTATQYFTCRLGSHHATPTGSASFSPLKGATLDHYNYNRSTIPVQPGHIIVFKGLEHEISGAKCTAISSKIWHSFFVHSTEQDLPYNPVTLARDLAIPPLPSGQRSPMYAKLHYVNWRPRLHQFSANIRDDLIDPATGLVHRFLADAPTASLGLPPYKDAELVRLRSCCLLP